MTHVPDFPAPSRGSGSEKTPDIAPKAPAGPSRGKYPKDAGGPPETKVGGGGPSGDPFSLSLTPTPVPRPAPAKSPRFNAAENTTK